MSRTNEIVSITEDPRALYHQRNFQLTQELQEMVQEATERATRIIEVGQRTIEVLQRRIVIQKRIRNRLIAQIRIYEKRIIRNYQRDIYILSQPFFKRLFLIIQDFFYKLCNYNN